jgi:hypothetical protein
MNIVPTPRADSASSMIRSDSISTVSDAARGDKTRQEEYHAPTGPRWYWLWRSWMAVMIRPKPTVLHSMVSGTSSAPTGCRSLEDDRARLKGSQASRRLGRAGERGRDGGWIITVESTS